MSQKQKYVVNLLRQECLFKFNLEFIHHGFQYLI